MRHRSSDSMSLLMGERDQWWKGIRVVVQGLLASVMISAGQDSSLSDLNIESTEAKLTLQSVAEENEVLKKQLLIAQEQVKSLTQSLGATTQEAEVFRRESGELRLRMEALGIDAASSDRTKLEQRLLKAVRDLELVQGEKDKISTALVRMSEAVLNLLKTAEIIDPEARLAVEAEMRAANQAMGVAPAAAIEAPTYTPVLTDATVIAVKNELALVVLNVGRNQGVQSGMPFGVWRGNRKLGTLRVVDVRDRIAGAVIQEFESEEESIKVGDTLKVDAQ